MASPDSSSSCYRFPTSKLSRAPSLFPGFLLPNLPFELPDGKKTEQLAQNHCGISDFLHFIAVSPEAMCGDAEVHACA